MEASWPLFGVGFRTCLADGGSPVPLPLIFAVSLGPKSVVINLPVIMLRSDHTIRLVYASMLSSVLEPRTGRHLDTS